MQHSSYGRITPSMSSEINAITRPPAILAALEMLRAGFEGWSLMLSGPMLAAAPSGDGHGVLVLPGFASNDRSTAWLRAFLEALGYEVHPERAWSPFARDQNTSL